ncbi:MAG: 16S rRNA (guanine(966)-N(2))-methyltransferase RsmD [Gammaproteobacteria bacterium]|nr:16S rRNA (guanine(966)-N(2))-methyltransferase RsmD [Gammaproteobacteria bacterium]
MAARPKRYPKPASGTHRLRIIGGRWRGRRLEFPATEGLRPTSDRVRETLFNWLAPMIAGARCLDLFAGSGALGIEALSRGADSVVMVDNNTAVVSQLHDHLATLRANGAQIIHAGALGYLQTAPEQAFDVVFLDPPYHKNLLAPCCDLLRRSGWLKPGAYIYLETERDLPLDMLALDWRVVRSKNAGQASYHLAIKQA